MKENKYDDKEFFDKYSQMDRSKKGLEGAGEWNTLKEMLPDFNGKRILDLGCGFGWHCKYAVDHGAALAAGIDISEKMLEEAKKRNADSRITYRCQPIEDVRDPDGSYDVVLSSLALHYVKSFEDVCGMVNRLLSNGGIFVFSAEHPVFTAYGTEDWYYDERGNILHWPVDRYFEEGIRETTFLGETVTKYHRTLTTYLNTLISHGFEITGIKEPQPPQAMLDDIPGMTDELRRPMMVIVSAVKKG